MQNKQLLTLKGERTFLNVLDSAIHLFQSKGFEDTSMRDISKHSGLALGAIYYYCRSKEELVFHFYQRVNEQIFAAYTHQLELEQKPKDLGQAFTQFVELKLSRLARYRKLLIVVLKESVDPSSPISPFNRPSAEFRDRTIDVFDKLISQYKTNAKDSVVTPRLLWFAHLAVISFWLYDKSEKHASTKDLTAAIANLINWSDAISAIPGVKQLLIKLTRSLESMTE